MSAAVRASVAAVSCVNVSSAYQEKVGERERDKVRATSTDRALDVLSFFAVESLRVELDMIRAATKAATGGWRGRGR